MRVWSFQPLNVYNQLMDNGMFQCDATKAPDYHYTGFKRAYNWLAKYMDKHISRPSDHCTASIPVWFWYKWNNQNKRPDLRRYEFKYARDLVLIEFEIPDEYVILSDYDDWHIILNDGIITDDGAVLDWYYDTATDAEAKAYKEANWPTVFHSDGAYVQGCAWSFQKEWVKNAKFHGKFLKIA